MAGARLLEYNWIMAVLQDSGRARCVPAAGLGPAPREEMREASRYPMRGTVRVGWVNGQREVTYITAQGLDISETGLSVRVATPLRESTLVHLELAGCGVSAVGRVRHCHPMGAEWRAGFEVMNFFPSVAEGAADWMRLSIE